MRSGCYLGIGFASARTSGCEGFVVSGVLHDCFEEELVYISVGETEDGGKEASGYR